MGPSRPTGPDSTIRGISEGDGILYDVSGFAWNATGPPGDPVYGPATDCLADLDGDNAVGITDCLEVLAAWGSCP